MFDRPTLKAFIITLVIKIAQQFDGYLIVLIYAGFVFEKASESISVKLSPNKQVMMIGLVQLLGSTVATCIVEKTGRKVNKNVNLKTRKRIRPGFLDLCSRQNITSKKTCDLKVIKPSLLELSIIGTCQLAFG